jgi:hypothetical protein
MKIHIEITDGKVEKAIKKIATKERWSMNKFGQVAIEFYLRARRILKG